MFHNSTAIHPRPNTDWPGDDLSSINTEDTIIGSLKNGGELDQSKVFLVISSRQSLDNPVDGGGIQSFSLDELGPTFNLPPSPLQNFAKNDANLILEKDALPAQNQFCSNLHKNKEDTLTESHNDGTEEVMTFYVAQSKLMECVEETASYCLEVIGPTMDSDLDASTNIAKNDVKEAESRPSPHPQEPKIQLRFPIKLPSKDFCLNQVLPEVEFVISFDDREEKEQVVKFNLQPFLQSSSSQQGEERSRTEATEEDNNSNNDAASFSRPLSPPSLNRIGRHQSPIVEINLGVLPKRKLRQPSRIQLPPTTSNKKGVIGDQGKIKGRAVPHNSKDEVDAKAGWRYSCYFCSKRLRAPSYLQCHLLVHTKEKPHPCHKCRKQFNLKHHLTIHLRRHDSNPTTRRPFKCDKCDKSFTQQSSLTTHVTTVHLRLKQFQCPECGQKFGEKSNMLTHLNSVHLGIRYPCRKPNCAKSFSQIGHLRKHEKKAH